MSWTCQSRPGFLNHIRRPLYQQLHMPESKHHDVLPRPGGRHIEEATEKAVPLVLLAQVCDLNGAQSPLYLCRLYQKVWDFSNRPISTISDSFLISTSPLQGHTSVWPCLPRSASFRFDLWRHLTIPFCYVAYLNMR